MEIIVVRANACIFFFIEMKITALLFPTLLLYKMLGGGNF